MWLIVIVSILALLLYFLGIKPYKHWEEIGVSYIKPLPFLGNVCPTLLRRKAFTDLLNDFYNAYPDKRYMGFFQLLSPVLMIRDPELIKIITVKEFDTFPEHRSFVPEDVDPLWNKNIVAIRDVQRWHDMRSTLSPSFTSSKMRLMFELMKDCSKQFTNHFRNQGGTVTIEMKDAFTRFTNDVIATTAFGVNCDSLENRNNEFYLMGKDASNFTGIKGLILLLSTISPSVMRLFNIGIFSKSVSTFFRKLVTETIKIREEKNIVRPDMIHLLMEARKGRLKTENHSNEVIDSGFAVAQESNIRIGTKRQKAQITDEDITAQALIFFLAGFDTASTFMCFAAYELAVNPDVQEKLRTEVDQTMEGCKGNLTYDAILGMKYLDMVVTETLRKWPPSVQTDRMSIRPFTIEPVLPGEKPITLSKGTNVWIPIFAIQRDPKYYPNPDKFDPERFSEENKDNIKPYTYLPFGVGPRNCIGSRFALLEGKLVIAELLSKFEIVPVAKTPVPLQLDTANFAPMPKEGFWLGLKPRSINNS